MHSKIKLEPLIELFALFDGLLVKQLKPLLSLHECVEDSGELVEDCLKAFCELFNVLQILGYLSLRIFESLFQVHVSLLELSDVIAHTCLETIKVLRSLTRSREPWRFPYNRLFDPFLPECVFVVFFTFRDGPRFALIVVVHLFSVDLPQLLHLVTTLSGWCTQKLRLVQEHHFPFKHWYRESLLHKKSLRL